MIVLFSDSPLGKLPITVDSQALRLIGAITCLGLHANKPPNMHGLSSVCVSAVLSLEHSADLHIWPLPNQ